MLYRKGANLNDKNKELLTPLHVAVDKSHYDVIDVLLKCRGTKVNALDSAGQTALHRAARDGNVQACRILLSYGADPHIVSLQGFTAADECCALTNDFAINLPSFVCLDLLRAVIA